MNLREHPDLFSKLSEALKTALPAAEALRMMYPGIKPMPDRLPDNLRESAVMLLLFPQNEAWHLLAIRRTEDGRAHSGQIGFPGGKREASDEDLQTTALRETFEEVGIPAERIVVAGALSPVFVVVSNYRVFPYVGFIDAPEDLVLSANEVQAVLSIPLRELFAPENKVRTEVVSPAFPDIKKEVTAYSVLNGQIIWGASAIMIAELELVLKSIFGSAAGHADDQLV